MSSLLTPTPDQVADIAHKQDEKEKAIRAAKAAQQHTAEEELAAAVIQVRPTELTTHQWIKPQIVPVNAGKT